MEAGVPLVYVRQAGGASGRALARAAFAALGRPAVDVDLSRLRATDEPRPIAEAATREARLRGAGLIAGPVEAIVERGASAVRAFGEARPPVVLVGTRGWDPAWSREVPLVLDAPVPDEAQRHELWVGALNGSAPLAFDPATATRAFRLGPEQVVRAARAAHRGGADAVSLINTINSLTSVDLHRMVAHPIVGTQSTQGG